MPHSPEPKAKRKAASKGAEADPEQYQRFLEAAHELGCEENFAQFEDALKRIVHAKPTPQGAERPAVTKSTKKEG